MDVVVRGRNVEVPDHYRQLVAEKLTRLERFDGKLIRVDVELQHERNRRQASACQHVQITVSSRGPVIRSEACSDDFYAALDLAMTKLERRMSKAADRRRVHHGRHRPTAVGEAAGRIDAVPAEVFDGTAIDAIGTTLLDGNPTGSAHDTADDSSGDGADPATGAAATHGDTDDSAELGQIVRRKHHTAAPMTSDEALHNMELVGHDFYLFADIETGCPSVVYRRKGFAYGVIHLGPEADDRTAAS